MTPSQTVRVVTLADPGFELALAVLGRSVLDHLEPTARLELTVIDGGLGSRIRDRLERSWRDPRLLLRWADPSYGGTSPVTTGRLPALTFARLAAADLLPADCQRAIVLDADQLVLADLSQLQATPLHGCCVLAPRDPFIATLGSPNGLRDCARLDLPVGAPYFTGALMVLNVARWRAADIGGRALAFARRHAQHLQTHDQDALNAVLIGRWRELDARWQVQPRALGLGRGAAGHLPLRERDRAAHNAAIVHFSGRLKPWLYRGTSVFDRMFFDTLDRTEWSGYRPPRNLRALAYRLYDSGPRRVLYPVEERVLRLAARSTARF